MSKQVSNQENKWASKKASKEGGRQANKQASTWITFSNSLKELNMDSLQERRESLCIKFAKKCLKVNKLRKMFPKKVTMHEMSKRNFEFYRVNKTLTNRYLHSAIPQMQRMLNNEKKKEIDILNQLNMPVNNDCCKSISLR